MLGVNDRYLDFEAAGWIVENVPGKGLCLTDRRSVYQERVQDLMHAPVDVVDSAEVYRYYQKGKDPSRSASSVAQKAAYTGRKGIKLGKGPKFGSISSFKPRPTDY